jgi:hypothetical protein
MMNATLSRFTKQLHAFSAFHAVFFVQIRSQYVAAALLTVTLRQDEIKTLLGQTRTYSSMR